MLRIEYTKTCGDGSIWRVACQRDDQGLTSFMEQRLGESAWKEFQPDREEERLAEQLMAGVSSVNGPVGVHFTETNLSIDWDR